MRHVVFRESHLRLAQSNNHYNACLSRGDEARRDETKFKIQRSYGRTLQSTMIVGERGTRLRKRQLFKDALAHGFVRWDPAKSRHLRTVEVSSLQ